VTHFHHHAASDSETRGRHIKWASHYDLLCRILSFGTIDRVRNETIALADLATGDHVVELGCGTGTLARRAKHAVGPNGQVIGIDASKEMVEQARALAHEENLAIEFLTKGMQATGLADGCADVVLVSLAMHHVLPEDRQRALDEIFRVLKPGGRLVIIDFEGPKGVFGKLVMTLLLHPKGPKIISETEAALDNMNFSSLTRHALPFPGLQALTGVKT